MLTDGQTDGRTTDAGVIGILIAHLGAFGSGELKMTMKWSFSYNSFVKLLLSPNIALKGNALYLFPQLA